MPEFNSVFELDIALKSVLKEVIEAVAKKVEDRLKYYIDSEVYIGENNYYHNGTGQPTYQFRESVDKTSPKSVGDGYEIEVYHNKDKMTYAPDTFLHGSNYPSPTDMREFLPEIINEGLAGNLFGSGFWTKKRPYFDKTIQDLVDNGHLDKFFREEFFKRGIVIE